MAYTVIEGMSLEQGDIITRCPLVVPFMSLLENASSSIEEIVADIRENPNIKIQFSDVMVLTQTCDLEQQKTDVVIVCPVRRVDEFVFFDSDLNAMAVNAIASNKLLPTIPKNKHDENFSENMATIIQGCKGVKNALNKIILGDRPQYFMLAPHKPEPSLRKSIVDFSELYSQPKTLLERTIQSQGPRLRLVSPLREHLSEKFGRYFSRVALPTPMQVEKYT